MNPRMLRYFLSGIVLLNMGLSLPAYAENIASTSTAFPIPSEGYSMMGWMGSLDIVQQLQTIHRFSQSATPEAIQGLVTALESQFPLARRKASRSLLEKVNSVQPDEKKVLVHTLTPEIQNTDPIVQKNIVRLMADVNIPEAQDTLRSFFKQSDKQAQLDAVDALSVEQSHHQTALNIARQLSPFDEVRQAASDILH